MKRCLFTPNTIITKVILYLEFWFWLSMYLCFHGPYASFFISQAHGVSSHLRAGGAAREHREHPRLVGSVRRKLDV